MILGSISQGAPRPVPDSFVLQPLPKSSAALRLYRAPWGAPRLYAEHTFAVDESSGSWLAFSGNPFWRSTGRPATAASLLEQLSSSGLKALNDLDGGFGVAWWQGRGEQMLLIRDRFGIEPLHYHFDAGVTLFGSRARDVAATMARWPGLSPQGLAEYLTYCYTPGNTTLLHGIFRVPAGSAVVVGKGAPVAQTWYRLSFADPWTPDEAQITANYRRLLEQSVVLRLDDSRAGLLLSGGMDSSSVATFAMRHLRDPISTFSFRCVGVGLDESVFSRQLAAELGTRHNEVEYGETQALDILDAVQAMDAPFCDIGIEIGTWLLAKAAGGRVDYLLTGDGGDELWASHPVYAAQKLMGWYDYAPLPRILRGLLADTLNYVRDSDQKRGLAVTLKRILPPAKVPRSLGHFRWRLYQTPDTLRSLLSPSTTSTLDGVDPFKPVIDSFEGYDGPADGMSLWLYSDYRTASSFYFNRLLLARAFGLETRTPFYDKELVEYGARIPARLKLEGIERTKRLFRAAMEGVLPDVINHRKDKLGHSVPFKSWLRQSGPLDLKIEETLRGEQFLARGLFKPEAVARLLDEHRTRRHNHSHRIWALFVLEHWMRAAESGSAAAVRR
jgi:asparagine synthase (glutamine-hydrolysing)